MGEFVFGSSQRFEPLKKNCSNSVDFQKGSECIDIGSLSFDKNIEKYYSDVNIKENPLYGSPSLKSCNSSYSITKKVRFTGLATNEDSVNDDGQRKIQKIIDYEKEDLVPVGIITGKTLLRLIIIFWTLVILVLVHHIYFYL